MNFSFFPARAPPAGGFHRAAASICFARAKSLSVMPPAECVFSLTKC